MLVGNAAEMLLWILQFFAVESCGKCTPGRIGTVTARKMGEKFVADIGTHNELKELRTLADTIGKTSFCGLGHSVAWPIKSAIDLFARDFVNGKNQR